VRHGRRGDLRFALTSPGGSKSVFDPRYADQGRDFYEWPFYSVVHWGEAPCGTWQLSVEDLSPGYSGELISWKIDLHGR
jgi:subtilisin-like proprotein convertase family protein